MLNSGITPILQSVPHTTQTAVLQAGQHFNAIVRVQNGTLVAQLSNLQLPLPEGAPFVAGQRVVIQVISAGNPLQIEISAANANPAPANATPTGLDAVLRPILSALNRLEAAPRASALIPPQSPATHASLQPLFTLLLAERGLGQDLQQLQQVLATASAQNAIPTDAVAAVVQWLGLAAGATSESWRSLLERARAERAAVARIAQTLGKGVDRSGLPSLRDSASALTQRLLDSEPFVAWLRERAESEPFKALAARLQYRAQGGDLQNLRSLDQPYQFLEIPVRENDGFRRVHLHSFSEERNGARHGGKALHQTILDLETTRLGALWIVVQAAGEQCACRIRTTSPAVAALFEAEAEELRAALESAGYRSATVTAELWDGDREEALYKLFAPYQRLDLEG